MGVTPHVAMLLLCSLALAGCSSGGGGGGGADDAETTGALSSTAVTKAPNRAPTAALEASTTSGDSPLDVTFTLGGSDLDNDTLSWSLTFGDGNQTTGTALPANATYVYTTAESLTVQAILTVTDGTLNATANVTIQVAAVAAAATQTILEGEVSQSCGTGDGCYVVGAEGCLSWLVHQQGIDCIWFDVTAELVGQSFVTESPGDVDLDFRTDCEVTGESVGIFGADGQEEGEVPAAGCVVMSDYVDGGLLRLIIG